MGVMRPKGYTTNRVARSLVKIADQSKIGAGNGLLKNMRGVRVTKRVKCPATAIFRKINVWIWGISSFSQFLAMINIRKLPATPVNPRTVESVSTRAHAPPHRLGIHQGVVKSNGHDGHVIEQGQQDDHDGGDGIKIKEDHGQNYEKHDANGFHDTVDGVAVHPLEDPARFFHRPHDH